MTQPDFIIIPTQLLLDDSLQPSDRILFGYIYWMTKLALMKCVASNAVLAELVGISERAVRLGLERLEKQGYVGRIYSDYKSHHRVEIVCQLAFSAVQQPTPVDLGTNVPSPRNKRSQPLGTNVPHNKSIKKKKIKKEVVTNVTTAPEAPETYGKPEINDLFSYWELTTGLPIQAKRQQNRNACNNLLRKYGPDKLRQLVDGVALSQTDRYAPRICDFISLQAKLNDLLAWGRRRTLSATEKVVSI